MNNIDKVQYSTEYVYVHGASIPAYSIGPWTANPNTPKNKDATYKYPRNPSAAVVKTATGLGAIGAWIDGVVIFNAKDGMTYNNQGVWNRNALIWESVSFDKCNGHPGPDGSYHLHVDPICLYSKTDNSKHSPLIGFGFDGFPIYGPFGYSDPNDPSSSIIRMTSSYTYRAITKRDTLPNGNKLSTAQQGPDVVTSATSSYRIGSFIEDYEFTLGSGTLDQYNGRFCKTPDYPNGIYAYFISTDSAGSPAYPFIIGPSYYGKVVTTNIGPNSGKNTPTEPVTTYF